VTLASKSLDFIGELGQAIIGALHVRCRSSRGHGRQSPPAQAACVWPADPECGPPVAGTAGHIARQVWCSWLPTDGLSSRPDQLLLGFGEMTRGHRCLGDTDEDLRVSSLVLDVLADLSSTSIALLRAAVATLRAVCARPGEFVVTLASVASGADRTCRHSGQVLAAADLETTPRWDPPSDPNRSRREHWH
jgi:hypothetical protein